MMQLRDYQTRAMDQLYAWFGKNNEGHPVVAMPGGSGKSVVIAAVASDAVKNWPDTRILMLVDSEILVRQNGEALRRYWPGAPLGIYSSGLGKRQLGEPITYAGIQSVWKRASEIGHIDICLVDEAHAISHKDVGCYRILIAALLAINPNMRVVGFSASPYRLGHGAINEGPDTIFTDILEPVSIEELIHKGALVPLISKRTTHSLDASNVRKSRGEYIEADMQREWNTDDHNDAVVQEIISRADGRNHWLVFCSGVQHAEDVAATFRKFGIPFAAVHSKDKAGGKKALEDFHAGKIKGVTSMGQLTTGYDFPALDCIAFLRKTMSPGLYLQMAVRGMRPFDKKDNCLVLDFTGLVSQHGPITAVQPPKRKGEGSGEVPMKVCDACDELVHISVMICPACGAPFPTPEKSGFTLRNDDIMGIEGETLSVTSWNWREHTSRTSGKDMLAVTYYGSLSDAPVTEYLTVMHEGYAGDKAMRLLSTLASNAGAVLGNTLGETVEALNEATPPAEVEFRKDGKFHRILKREW